MELIIERISFFVATALILVAVIAYLRRTIRKNKTEGSETSSCQGDEFDNQKRM